MNSNQFRYITENSIEKRKADFMKIKSKYFNKIPVIVECPNREIKKSKFLMEEDQSVADLIIAFRKLEVILPHEALFVFTYNPEPVIVNGQQSIGEVYSHYKQEDGFVYFHILKENTFGTVM